MWLRLMYCSPARQVADQREERYKELVRSLQGSLSGLEAEVRGHIAARNIHERLSAQLGRRLADAEYVAERTRERSAAVGLSHLVPLGRCVCVCGGGRGRGRGGMVHHSLFQQCSRLRAQRRCGTLAPCAPGKVRRACACVRVHRSLFELRCRLTTLIVPVSYQQAPFDSSYLPVTNCYI